MQVESRSGSSDASPPQDVLLSGEPDIDSTQVAIFDPRATDVVTPTMPERCAVRSLLLAHLPADILIAIFRQALSIQNPRDPYISIIISHVCREWREVALTAPTLWNTIFFPGYGLELTRQLLNRSQAAVLDVHITLQFHLDANLIFPANLFDLILGEIHRIRRLFIVVQQGSRNCDISHIMQHLKNPAPCLETLHVESPSLRPVFLPPRVLDDGSVSALKEVTITGCSAAWSLPIFRRLTHLNLTLNARSRPSASKILAVLESCPELQELTMTPCYFWEDAWDEGLDAYNPSREKIFTTTAHGQLWKIICELGCEEGVPLFRSLKAASLDSWSITLARTPLPAAAPSIAEAIPPIPICHAVQCEIHAGRHHMTVYVQSNSSLELSGRSSPKCLKLHASRPYPLVDTYIQSLAILVRSTNMAQATDLTVVIQCWHQTASRASWRDLMNALPHLEQLSVSVGDVAPSESGLNLLRALQVSHEDGGIVGNAGPRLRSLVLSRVKPADPDAFYDQLVAFAEARSLSGSPLMELRMEGSTNASDNHIRLLTNLVEHFSIVIG